MDDTKVKTELEKREKLLERLGGHFNCLLNVPFFYVFIKKVRI